MLAINICETSIRSACHVRASVYLFPSLCMLDTNRCTKNKIDAIKQMYKCYSNFAYLLYAIRYVNCIGI